MAEIEESKITDITGGSELDKMDARAKAAVVVVSLGADRTTNARTIIWHQFCFLLFFKLLKVLLDTELGVS